MEVEHFISMRTHKSNALRFWVKMWCPTHLYSCSEPNVDDSRLPPRDPTVVSESMVQRMVRPATYIESLSNKGGQAASPVEQ
ncbi:hypothetical protein A2U01_0055825, partial [Trifolium medium]|nr:hypothetical protein [Trifolium medium]